MPRFYWRKQSEKTTKYIFIFVHINICILYDTMYYIIYICIMYTPLNKGSLLNSSRQHEHILEAGNRFHIKS